MAYNIFPKTEKELREKTRGFPAENVGELVLLFNYLKANFPKLETPICLDATKKSSPKISRSIQEDTSISKIKREAKITKLTLAFGNGSSGNRGVNNRGNNFEPQFAYDLNQWWEGNTPQNQAVMAAIKHLDETYDLKKSKSLKISLEGGENTKRPIAYTPKLHITNPKGSGTDVGPSVTDITLITDKEKIYLSLKLGSTVTFFNVGVRTVLPPNDIKAYDIKGDGKKLLDLFGIDPKLFCDVFNGKLSTKTTKVASFDAQDMKYFLASGIGHGYHIIHKMSSKILSKKMDEAAMNKAATVGSATIYYGGKTGTGKRVDIEMESPTYKFKLNIRDTQGKDGYPTRLMCDFSYK